MEHEKIENQRDPETGEFIGYPAWTEEGYPISALGVVLDCEPPCDFCWERMVEIRDNAQAEGTWSDRAEAEFLRAKADRTPAPDFEKGETNGRGWPIARSGRD